MKMQWEWFMQITEGLSLPPGRGQVQMSCGKSVIGSEAFLKSSKMRLVQQVTEQSLNNKQFRREFDLRVSS